MLIHLSFVWMDYARTYWTELVKVVCEISTKCLSNICGNECIDAVQYQWSCTTSLLHCGDASSTHSMAFCSSSTPSCWAWPHVSRSRWRTFSCLSRTTVGGGDPSLVLGIIVNVYILLAVIVALSWWRCGVAVEHRTRDQEVAGSSLGRALWHKNSGQVSHT